MENEIVIMIDSEGKRLVGVCVKADSNGEPLVINVWGIIYQKVGKFFKRKMDDN